MEPLPVSAAGARRFLVRRHGLEPPRAMPAGPDGVRAVVARLGSIQFDPLAVAGRNHDLVLHARVRDYDPAWTQSLLYDSRELFETINKMLSLLPTSELPWFRLSWARFLATHQDGAFTRHAETMDHVLERLRAEGPLCSLDFERRAAVDWYWGPTNEVRAVLEALTEAGIISIARREGNRRYFDLTERLFPAALLADQRDAREQRRHKLLSRYRAHGLLGEGGQSELWYGLGAARRAPGDGPGTLTRQDLREELLDSGELLPVAVEGVRGTRHVIATELPLLKAAEAEVAEGRAIDEPGVAFIAPLDSFAWDRDLLRSLFGFDYVWEVYVPRAKRRWGYYVLPLLFGDRLVGRIEPRIDRAARTVRILGAWWEPGFRPREAEGFVPAMRAALAAYLRFAGADRLEWAAHLGPERRLIGVRPRSS